MRVRKGKIVVWKERQGNRNGVKERNGRRSRTHWRVGRQNEDGKGVEGGRERNKRREKVIRRKEEMKMGKIKNKINDR